MSEWGPGFSESGTIKRRVSNGRYGQVSELYEVE